MWVILAFMRLNTSSGFWEKFVKIPHGRRRGARMALLPVTAALVLLGSLGTFGAQATAAQAKATAPAAATIPKSPTTNSSGLPDPTARGPYGFNVIEEAKFGTAWIEE